MKLLIIGPLHCGIPQMDAELLRARGYDAVTYTDLLVSEDFAGKRCARIPLRTMRALLALELINGRNAVLHPDIAREMREKVLDLCKFLCLPVARMEDLPACNTENQEVFDSLNILGACGVRAVAACAPLHKPSLRERWLLFQRRILRWEARANRHLSDLKNPMSLSLQEAAERPGPKPYPALEDRPTTTG